ncbi:caspase family protein [bacterium]|nr:caspase family protein [bacterium]
MLVSLVALRPTPAQAETWALVVGIDNYQRPEITKLTYAGADARLFSQALYEILGVPKNNIFLLTSDATEPDLCPLLPNLAFRLDALRQCVKPEDTVIFYFAGHGVALSDEDSFLLTAEADNRSPNTLQFTSLRIKALNEFLNKTRAQKTLVVLDACRNDPSSGRGDSNNLLSEQFARSLVLKPATNPASPANQDRSQATLFACGMGERSYEWHAKHHGFFTYYLVEGLKQGSADASGKVTLGALSTFLQKEVRASTGRELARPQSPSLRYEGPGPEQWVLASGRPRGAASDTNSSASKELSEARAAQIRAEQDRNRLEIEKARLESEKARWEAEKARLEAENQRLASGQRAPDPNHQARQDATAAVLASIESAPKSQQSRAADQALALAQAKAEATEAIHLRLEAERAKLDAELKELQNQKARGPANFVSDALAAVQADADRALKRNRAEADERLKAAVEAEALAEKKFLELQSKSKNSEKGDP